MLRRDGFVKVLDFGLAKLAEPRATPAELEAPTQMRGNTSPGVVMGTVNYMSPEQARGLEVDERTDIWSLGVVLYEMLSGSAPFKGQTPTDVTVSILEREPVSLATMSQDLPAELDWIVKKALRKDREERYQTIKEMQGDIRGLKQELEFAAKLERSAIPNSSSEDRQAPVKKSVEAVVSLTTDKTAVISTDEIKVQLANVDQQASKAKRRRTSVIAAAVALGLVAVGVAFYKLFLTGTTVAPFEAMSIKRLTNHGKAIIAAISPDGKYFAYVLTDAGKQSLWIRQTNATNDTQVLPPAPVGFFGLTFSRDGTELYYVVKANDPGTLYRLPALGGTPVKLLEKLDSPVSFSPDGKRLAFVRGDFPNRGDSAIIIANSDGSGEQTIAERKLPELFVPIPFTGPSWSPDGKLLACAVTNTKSESRVVAVNIEDGKETILTSRAWPTIGRVAWLPDMSGLLMAARDEASTTSQLWDLSYPGGEARKVTNDLNAYRDVNLTADGSKLITIQTSGLINIWVVPDLKTENAVRSPAADRSSADELGSPIKLGVGNVGFQSGNESISWTPDGRIVFVSASGKQGDIWIVNPDGSNRKQLTFGTGDIHNPDVSQDGRYIAFTSSRSGQRNVWRMNLDGSDLRRLTNGQADYLPGFSPDSRWIVYSSLNSGILTLWKVPTDGGTPIEIVNRQALNPVVSPDGGQIAYLFSEGTAGAPPNRIAVIPFEGGEPVTGFEVPQGLAAGRTILSWSKDGRSLLYTAIANNVSNIWSQSLEGGTPKQITDFREHIISAFDWSRDGHRLACARGLVIRDAVLISNAK